MVADAVPPKDGIAVAALAVEWLCGNGGTILPAKGIGAFVVNAWVEREASGAMDGSQTLSEAIEKWDISSGLSLLGCGSKWSPGDLTGVRSFSFSAC
jgi:hypothetical protein